MECHPYLFSYRLEACATFLEMTTRYTLKNDGDFEKILVWDKVLLV